MAETPEARAARLAFWQLLSCDFGIEVAELSTEQQYNILDTLRGNTYPAFDNAMPGDYATASAGMREFLKVERKANPSMQIRRRLVEHYAERLFDERRKLNSLSSEEWRKIALYRAECITLTAQERKQKREAEAVQALKSRCSAFMAKVSQNTA